MSKRVAVTALVMFAAFVAAPAYAQGAEAAAGSIWTANAVVAAKTRNSRAGATTNERRMPSRCWPDQLSEALRDEFVFVT